MKRIEFYLLVSVAVVSSWHVVKQFSGADALWVAIIQGVALSALLAYFAHGVAAKNGWQKGPALVGLFAFAAFSATFQTIHFLDYGASMWESVARGCWAPLAEVLLGLLLVHGVKSSSKKQQKKAGRFDVLLDAGVSRLAASLDGRDGNLETTTETVQAVSPVVETPKTMDREDKLLQIETIIKADPFASLASIRDETGIPKSSAGKVLNDAGYHHNNGDGWTANGNG